MKVFLHSHDHSSACHVKNCKFQAFREILRILLPPSRVTTALRSTFTTQMKVEQSYYALLQKIATKSKGFLPIEFFCSEALFLTLHPGKFCSNLPDRLNSRAKTMELVANRRRSWRMGWHGELHWRHGRAWWWGLCQDAQHANHPMGRA